MGREVRSASAAGLPMIELIASMVVDLSDQKLTVYDSQDQVVRVIPVSTGKASTPTPTGLGSVLTKYRSVTMRGRGYVAPGVQTHPGNGVSAVFGTNDAVRYSVARTARGYCVATPPSGVYSTTANMRQAYAGAELNVGPYVFS